MRSTLLARVESRLQRPTIKGPREDQRGGRGALIVTLIEQRQLGWLWPSLFKPNQQNLINEQ